MQKHALKNGVILSGISIILVLIIYVIDVTLLAKWYVGIGVFVLSMTLVSYFGIQYRKEIGGYLGFKGSFMYSYLTFIVAGFVSTIFNILLYTVIDPELPHIILEASLENTEQILRSFGAPDSAIDEAIAKMEVDIPAQLSAMGQVKFYGWALLIYLGLSLITGLIIRKNEPEPKA